MKKVLVLIADSNGRFPVPATKGGAVSSLVENMVQANEKEQICFFDILSYWDEEAEKQSKNYKNSHFHWVKISPFVNWIDNKIFNFICTVFPKKKAISYKSILSLIIYIIKANFLLYSMEYDEIIVENNVMLFWSFIMQYRKYKGKVHLHLHNIPRISGKNKFIQSQVLDSVISVSNFVSKHNNILCNRKTIVNNCIDLQKFNIDKDDEILNMIRDKYHICNKDYIILYAGRISKEKGIDKLINAISNSQNCDNITLLIVGSVMHGLSVKDLYTEKVLQLVETLQVNVVFCGYIANHYMKYYYQLADLVVLPSMWDEPAGLTMIEAMASGATLITTDSGGIPEYVKNGAIILSRKDIESTLPQAIDYLLDNPNERKKLSIRGSKIAKNYSIDCYAEKIYEAITGD